MRMINFVSLVAVFFFSSILPTHASNVNITNVDIESEMVHDIAMKFSKLLCPTLNMYAYSDRENFIMKAFIGDSFNDEWLNEVKKELMKIDSMVKIEVTAPRGLMYLPRDYAHLTVLKQGKQRNYIVVYFPDSSGILCEE